MKKNRVIVFLLAASVLQAIPALSSPQAKKQPVRSAKPTPSTAPESYKLKAQDYRRLGAPQISEGLLHVNVQKDEAQFHNGLAEHHFLPKLNSADADQVFLHEDVGLHHGPLGSALQDTHTPHFTDALWTKTEGQTVAPAVEQTVLPAAVDKGQETAPKQAAADYVAIEKEYADTMPKPPEKKKEIPSGVPAGAGVPILLGLRMPNPRVSGNIMNMPGARVDVDLCLCGVAIPADHCMRETTWHRNGGTYLPSQQVLRLVRETGTGVTALD